MSTADSRANSGPNDPALTALALLYANGELEGAEAEAFEKRLADDQDAREALSQAVLLTGTLGGREPPRPNPAYRDRIRERLLPGSGPAPSSRPAGWWSAVLRPQVYRGHPMVWLLSGALAAALLVFCAATARAPSGPAPRPAIPAQVTVRLPPARQQAEPVSEKMAEVWAELHSINHLERVRAEEARRKHRLEERRLAHSEDRATRGETH